MLIKKIKKGLQDKEIETTIYFSIFHVMYFMFLRVARVSRVNLGQIGQISNGIVNIEAINIPEMRKS